MCTPPILRRFLFIRGFFFSFNLKRGVEPHKIRLVCLSATFFFFFFLFSTDDWKARPVISNKCFTIVAVVRIAWGRLLCCCRLENLGEAWPFSLDGDRLLPLGRIQWASDLWLFDPLTEATATCSIRPYPLTTAPFQDSWLYNSTLDLDAHYTSGLIILEKTPSTRYF